MKSREIVKAINNDIKRGNDTNNNSTIAKTNTNTITIFEGEQSIHDTRNFINTFDQDSLSIVLSFLSVKRICRLSLVSKLFLMASNDTKLWELIFFRTYKGAIFDQDYKHNNNILIVNKTNKNKNKSSNNNCNCFNIDTTKKKTIVCRNKASNHNWKGLTKTMHILNKKKTINKTICHIIGCHKTIMKTKMKDHLKLHL